VLIVVGVKRPIIWDVALYMMLLKSSDVSEQHVISMVRAARNRPQGELQDYMALYPRQWSLMALNCMLK
jgi:hypothetical protein